MNYCDHWQYRVDPPQSGAENMRVDRALLTWAEESVNSVTAVRFYRWSRPTISLGRNQKPPEAVNTEFCRQQGLPIVLRPTGGRAVLHHNEVTYALVSNDPEFFPLKDISETYRLIAQALQAGLKQLGISVRLAKGSPDSHRFTGSGHKNPCFASSSRYELLSEGLKIVGSAQRRLRRSFLQHGSIPLQVDYSQMAQALASEELLLRKKVISVLEAGGREFTFEEVCQALKEGIEKTFSIRLESSPFLPTL
ncbi:MAG: lipoate--protein ligase family protein [Acidobacteriota bacterium]